MPTPLEIRRRVKSVKNISQVTRAMEAVSASKMRRAQNLVLATRPYAQKAWDIASFLARQSQGNRAPHSLLVQRPEDRVALVLITPDKGLTGGMVSNILRAAANFKRHQKNPVSMVTIGRKGRDFFARFGGGIIAEDTKLGDTPPLNRITPLARLIIDGFVSHTGDDIALLMSHTRGADNTDISFAACHEILSFDPAGPLPAVSR